MPGVVSSPTFVPPMGLEPINLAAADFESAVSTKFHHGGMKDATGASLPGCSALTIVPDCLESYSPRTPPYQEGLFSFCSSLQPHKGKGSELLGADDGT